MKSRIIAPELVFTLLIAFVSVALEQTADKGWEKTVALPSGS